MKSGWIYCAKWEVEGVLKGVIADDVSQSFFLPTKILETTPEQEDLSHRFPSLVQVHRRNVLHQ